MMGIERRKGIVLWREYFQDYEYYRPKTIDEALELLSKLKDDHAVVMAGATCLTRNFRGRKFEVKHVIDLKGIPELKGIKYTEGEGLKIGSVTTFYEILKSDLIRRKYTAIWEAAKQYGDFELRFRATIGGNIAKSSPQNDSSPPLLVHKATLTIASANRTREVPLEKFFTGVTENVLAPNEIITSINVPEPPEGSKSGYIKFKRSAEDRALVGIAALVSKPKDRHNRIIRLAYSSIAKTPVFVKEAEEIFRKEGDFNALIDEAINTVYRYVDLPIGHDKRGQDLRASKEYRMHLIGIGTKAILKKLIEGVEVF